jgi:hypothetical protein
LHSEGCGTVIEGPDGVFQANPIVTDEQTSMDCRGKHGSATMLYVALGILAILLSYAFVQATQHADSNAEPHAPLHDTK